LHKHSKLLAAAAFCSVFSLLASYGQTLADFKSDQLPDIAAANDGLYSSLQSFVCSERIERFAEHKRGDQARHLDTLNAQVSFENGQEHYSAVERDGQHLAGLSNVAGAWSEGEFGTLLRQTEHLLRSETVEFKGEGQLSGRPVTLVVFDVSQEESPWDLTVAGRHYRVAFRTQAWLEKSSGEILKIVRTSNGAVGATRIARLEWSVTLGPIDLNGRKWLLPKEGNYSVEYAITGRREWNQLSFSNYHRYGSEVALHFEGQEEP
jgi:hypothetical protein